MPFEITRKTPIGELVMNFPSSVEVLFGYGFHCIGCGLSAYETIEDGAAAHGFDDDAIDRLVDELKEAVKNGAKAFSGEAGDAESAAAGNPQKNVGADKKPVAPKKAGTDGGKKPAAGQKIGKDAKEKKPEKKGKQGV